MMPKAPRCFTCKGNLIEDTASEYHEVNNRTIIVRGIPCEKCTQCGEVFFELSIGVKVEDIVDAVKEATTSKITVVQYSEDTLNAVQYIEAEAIAVKALAA